MGEITFGRHVTAPYLSSEHSKFRTYVRDALRSRVVPYAEQWETDGRIPRSAWAELAGLGLLRLAHTGKDFLHSAIFLEELGGIGYAGIRAAIAVHSYMALAYLELFGSPEQRARYVVSARAGSQIAALAISETEGGSDLRHLKTGAVRASDSTYRVNGEKSYVANGTQADFLITLVRTGAQTDARILTGCSFAVIDTTAKGVVRFPQSMTGWRSADIARIEFSDVEISESSILGVPGQALRQIVRALDFERLVAGILAIGGVRYCLGELSRSISERRVRDVPLSRNSAIQHQVAELRGEYEMVRQYAYHAAWLQSEGSVDALSASILKLKATELAMAAAEKCVRYQGALGYLAHSPAARMYEDALGGVIAGGASDLVREMIFELG